MDAKRRFYQLPDLPKPVPHREVFVHAPRVEGVHLRAGPVARGGIRWSDRREDFRTEVLGLMKAQVVKNAVIVPTGAKGGFVVRRPPADRTALATEGRAAYELFIAALLDVTDDRVRGEVVPPRAVVRHDGDDPYLVVAADKGTATFSDLANALAVARGSGPAVAQLGAIARQAGSPVSLHGTGGAWMVADRSADAHRFKTAVYHSLDRKVCNTLNVCAIVRERANDLVPAFLEALEAAAERRQGVKLHVVEGSQGALPADWLSRRTTVVRAEGPVDDRPVVDEQVDHVRQVAEGLHQGKDLAHLVGL